MHLLKTKRTTIRNITLDDAPFMLKLTNSPNWLKYIGNRNIYTIEDAENYIIKFYLKNSKKLGFTYYLININENTPIGICGFLKKQYLENPDLGFAFLPEFQGMGYGYEAGSAILNYGISELGLNCVDAVTMRKNSSSIALLMKLGFIENGTITIPDNDEEIILFRFCNQSSRN